MKKAPWSELVGGRILIRDSDHTEQHRPLLEAIVLEVSPSKANVRLSLVGFGVVWCKDDDYEYIESLPNTSPLTQHLKCWEIIDRLRTASPASAVTVLCPNEEGSGPDNHGVWLSTEATDYHDRAFYGATPLDALIEAAKWTDSVMLKKNPQHKPIYTP